MSPEFFFTVKFYFKQNPHNSDLETTTKSPMAPYSQNRYVAASTVTDTHRTTTTPLPHTLRVNYNNYYQGHKLIHVQGFKGGGQGGTHPPHHNSI